MSKHFFKISMNYSSKNKFDEEFNKYANEHDATLLKNDFALKRFLEKLKNKLKELHEKHSRCQAITFDKNSFSDQTTSLRVGCTQATIYRIKREE